jgi:tRNA (adenine37-N6)-methyltransferase
MIVMEPIGFVRASRVDPEDDFWGGAESSIVLTDAVEPDALLGLEAFSHAEIIYCLDQVDPDGVVRSARHPRNNPDWPRVGIFAQRTKNRPNRIGATIVKIVGCEGRTLRVLELDAIDNTPVLDIKPVMREFLPRDPVVQPQWSHEMMHKYWARRA